MVMISLKLKDLLVDNQQLSFLFSFFIFFFSRLFIVFILKFFSENWHDKIKISAEGGKKKEVFRVQSFFSFTW